MSGPTGILGTGGWGTTLSIVAAENNEEVYLWGRRPGFVEKLRESRANERYLPGVEMPPDVKITPDLDEVTSSVDLLVVAVPTPYIRSLLEKHLDDLPSDGRYVSAAKGVEAGTFMRPTQILRDVLGTRVQTGVISGPSHAEEVARRKPSSIVSASETIDLAAETRDRFMTNYLRIYTNPDFIGVELAGALKNIIAIACGICVGRDLGLNAQSALLSRGLVEMSRFGSSLGGKKATFHGLAGTGDLITTCMSPHGRNRSVGIRLGNGESMEEIEEDMDQVAEGIRTTRSVRDMAEKRDIEMPITDQVYRVLYEGKKVQEAVRDLMGREPRSEAEDLM